VPDKPLFLIDYHRDDPWLLGFMEHFARSKKSAIYPVAAAIFFLPIRHETRHD
jgi:hypothetical protein